MLAGTHSPIIRYPGLAQRQADQELYTAPALGSIAFDIFAGDELEITTPYGEQCCDLFAFNRSGKSALGALSLSASSNASSLEQFLGKDKARSRQAASSLKRRAIATGNAPGCRVLNETRTAGSHVPLTSQENLFVVICAPGTPMEIDGQSPPTEIRVKLVRANPLKENELPLPEPVTDPRLDFRIDASTAQSYQVREGEYIQVIDVAGRECSDFQAFAIRSLDRNIIDAINVTTTRSLSGHGYPMPGLQAKYFDTSMQPLVEVVQDTVGRHDTFGLACTSRYYEDMGYFGHPNCTDNFNAGLKPYGIPARKGWEAVNLFYNTGIDENNVIYSDEPWSRPGDFVMFRALTDLVCVSSACPDDTSAANGWNPTDIHVRVYSHDADFKKSIAYRNKPDGETKMTQETAFHSKTSQLTRKFVEYKGFWLPSGFTNSGAENEYYACREKVIVTDLSPLRKFEITGPDSESLMQWCVTRNARKITTGQVSYTAMCHEHGGMFDDGTLLRLGKDNFRWIGGDEYGGEWIQEQSRAKGLVNVRIKPSTEQIHNIAVQGPQSRKLLEQIVWSPPQQPCLEELGWFRFLVGRLFDYNGPAILVSRTGYTGELGYELFCHPRHAPEVWDAVWERGEPLGICPLGLDALDMLRIEAGLVFSGYEFCEQTDPFEAGIGFTVPLKSKHEDFLGKQALIRRKESPQRTLVGLEVSGDEPAVHGDCVHVGRPQVGVITSATRSPILNKNIALCRLDIIHSEIGNEVEIGKLDGQQKRIPAKVVPYPFYDPEKKRVRA